MQKYVNNLVFHLVSQPLLQLMQMLLYSIFQFLNNVQETTPIKKEEKHIYIHDCFKRQFCDGHRKIS